MGKIEALIPKDAYFKSKIIQKLMKVFMIPLG